VTGPLRQPQPPSTLLNLPQLKPVKYLKEFVLVFLILGGLLSGLDLLLDDEKSLWSFFRQWIMNGTGSVLMWSGNSYLADALSIHFPWTKDSIKRLVVTILATLIYTFVAWLILVWLSSVLYHWVLNWEGLRHEIFNGSFFVTLIITVLISAFMHGRGFLLAWKETLIEAEQLKKEQMAARYEALKNQVNPHFLFNNFNVLATLVHKDADLAERFIKQMANVYRYVLDSREKEVVSLEEELKQLEAYIFLMKIRFGESLKIEIDPSLSQLEGKNLAPLTLQMLVENALKHNEASKSNPLLIEVLWEKEDYVVVRNKLQTKLTVGESTGVGLENISARYNFLSDKPVLSPPELGFFTVKIPLVPA
jgi:sensor histidine kinase YesM